VSEPFRIFIPEATPSLNVWERTHFRKKKRERERWAKMLLAEIARLGGPHALKAAGKRRLTVERHGKRKLDDDNRAGGCKGLIDEIRRFGLLVDDKTAYLELVTLDFPLGKGMKPHTVLLFEEIEA
jgi:hypothetical protein